MAFKAQIKGLDSLLKKVQTKSKDLQEDVQEEIEDFGRRVVLKAKTRVPKDAGGGAGLSGAIFSEAYPNGLSIVAAKDYAAYVEFGTGRYVFEGEPWITPEIKAYAQTFFVNGKGLMKPQPFFFNSFFEEKQQLLDNISKKLAK